MFSDRTPAIDVTIEVNGAGYLNIGERTFSIIDGAAHVGQLPQGEYAVSVTGKHKIYRANEKIIVTDAGMARVDDYALWQTVVHLKEQFDSVNARLKKAEKQLEEYEERISGYSLFD